MGFEALCRGFKNDQIVYPGELFKLAKDIDKQEVLEEHCRYSALKYYNMLGQHDKLLFINFDMSAIKSKNSLEKFIFSLDGVNPKNVCIEFIESKISFKLLKYAVYLFQHYGFLIALDDFGSGYSNYSRLSIIKPDIVKLDMSLIRDIELDKNKQYIVKSLTNLVHNLGGITLAEGVETEQELMSCLDLDVDMFQGYLLSKPQCYKSVDIENTEKDFKDYLLKFSKLKLDSIKKHLKKLSLYRHMIERISLHVKDVQILKHFVEHYDFIRAIYLLDWEGKMVYDTFAKRNHVKRIFKPAKKGDDLSLKDYFIHIRYNEKDIYFSDPYISQIDGRQCITVSYKTKTMPHFVLCVDFTV